MQVIRDWKQLKATVDPNYTYTCMGISKGTHLFNFTHEHIVNHCIGKAQKLFACVWDNYYDHFVFNNLPATPATYDDANVINWFTNKGFDYLFIPDTSFIHEILAFPLFQTIRTEVDQIWVAENYGTVIGKYGTPYQINWAKMLFSRNTLFYTHRSGSKYINRLYQPIGPDGNYGFLYKHYWKNYCGIDCDMVPLLRNPNGLAFDIQTVNYPQDIIDFVASFVPAFNQFRIDNATIPPDTKDDSVIVTLMDSINGIAAQQNSGFKYNVVPFKNELTLGKYIFEISLTRNQPAPGEQSYRFWEYDAGI